MKNLIKISLVFVAAIMILAACSKDQKCVNWLEGDWSVTGLTIKDSSGASYDAIALAAAFGGSVSGTFSFDKYSVKKDEMGSGTSVLIINAFGQSNTENATFDYKIEDDCSTVAIREQGQTNWEDATITEGDKKKFIFSRQEGNETYTFTIEKD